MNQSVSMFLDDLDRRDEERREDLTKPQGVERRIYVNEIRLNKLGEMAHE